MLGDTEVQPEDDIWDETAHQQAEDAPDDEVVGLGFHGALRGTDNGPCANDRWNPSAESLALEA